MDIEQIRKLALLSRLDVPETELKEVSGEMGNIIGLVSEIQNVEISVAESTTDGSINVFRDDIVMPLLPKHDLVEAAASHKDHFVSVPKVIGE